MKVEATHRPANRADEGRVDRRERFRRERFHRPAIDKSEGIAPMRKVNILLYRELRKKRKLLKDDARSRCAS